MNVEKGGAIGGNFNVESVMNAEKESVDGERELKKLMRIINVGRQRIKEEIKLLEELKETNEVKKSKVK